MPLETKVWRIQDLRLTETQKSRLDSEVQLHGWIKENPSLISSDLLLIGSEVRTEHQGRLDLLGIDSAGTVHIIELKKEKTPRDVVAQALDYASWIVTLGYEALDGICRGYRGLDLLTAYDERFRRSLPETVDGKDHSITIVASSLDEASERIVRYLSDCHGLNINAVFFSIFEDDAGKLLTRTWLIEPAKVSARAIERTERDDHEDWTGYYFVNISVEQTVTESTWEDSQKYGFVSANGGALYRNAMQKLQSGDKIFAYANKHGYVGYGTVAKSAVLAKDFRLRNGQLLLDQPLAGSSYLREELDDEDLAAYVVAVDWIIKVNLEAAKRGPSYRGQVVCRIMKAATIDFLWKAFGIATKDMKFMAPSVAAERSEETK